MTLNRFAPIQALMDTDAYKLDHRRQYPVGTTGVLSNFTNRGSRIPEITHVVNFGLQGFLQKWAIEAWEPFWAAGEDEVASLYGEFVTSVLGPNTIGTDHIRALHRLGYLPLKFRSLPEGALVPLRVPSFTVENTLPEFYWLVNYIETALSASVWQPSTSATTAYRLRKLFDEHAIKTTGSKAGVEWQGHDFSFRGMAGIDAASASGAGHLLNFYGSDNLNAANFIEGNYPGNNGLLLGSVAATEHSVMCAGGNDEGNEQATFERLLKLYPSGIVSVVSDTWDLWNVLTVILPNLKADIMARDGKLVVRPDSGDPVDILTGTVNLTGKDEATLKLMKRYLAAIARSQKLGAPVTTFKPEQLGVIELLWGLFGGTINEQGYKVLDSHIGAIYGDSINFERAKEIFERLEAKGFASTNVVFGVGSYTYQYVTRDTFGSAIKATWVKINGEGKAIWKDPKTDNGLKKSAKGRIAVAWKDNDYVLVDDSDKTGNAGSALEGTPDDMLAMVWENGHFLHMSSFAEVRSNLHPEGIA